MKITFSDLFGTEVFGDAGSDRPANAIALSALTPPFGTILCSDVAHIETSECGATEMFSGGAKLTRVPARRAICRRFAQGGYHVLVASRVRSTAARRRPGTPDSQRALWRGLATGIFQAVSSDHSAFRFGDTKGKLAFGSSTPFNRIPQGLPGLETRLPLLFSEGVGSNRLTLNQFVALTATEPAKIFGLYPRKGTIAVGSDADLVIWDRDREVEIRAEDLSRRDGLYSIRGQDGQRVAGRGPVTRRRCMYARRTHGFTGPREVPEAHSGYRPELASRDLLKTHPQPLRPTAVICASSSPCPMATGAPRRKDGTGGLRN